MSCHIARKYRKSSHYVIENISYIPTGNVILYISLVNFAIRCEFISSTAWDEIQFITQQFITKITKYYIQCILNTGIYSEKKLFHCHLYHTSMVCIHSSECTLTSLCYNCTMDKFIKMKTSITPMIEFFKEHVY